MATVNRFSQIVQPERFNPLSFEEMSFAPILLRERQDQLLNQQDEILNQLNNITVPEVYQEQFDKERDQFKNDITTLSERINSEGAGNLNLLGDFRNLRNKYNKSVSTSGNIGRAAGLDATIKATKDKFFQHGIEQGYNPELVNKKWQEELSKFTSGLPSDLSKHSGQLPEFTPNYAPKNIDLGEEMIKMGTLLRGIDEDVLQQMSFKPQTDPDGNVVGYTVVNERGEEVTNNSQVNAFKDYMNNKVLNENSDLNQSLRFRGIDPTTYISQVDNLANMMRINKNADIQSYAGQIGGGNGTKKTTSGNATLNELSNGWNLLKNTQSRETTKEAIEDVRKDPNMLPEQKNKQLTILNHAYKRNKQMEETPEFQKQINEAIKSNDILKDNFGITNLQDYEKFINDPVNNEERETTGITLGNAPGMTSEIISDAAQAKSIYDRLYTDTSKELLGNTGLYSLGYDVLDQKLEKIVNGGLSDTYLRDAAATGKLSIMSEDNTFEEISPKGNEDNIERYNSFVSNITNSSKTSYQLQAIEDGGLSGTPALLYKVNAKIRDDEKTFHLSMDLGKDDLSQQLLNPNNSLYAAMDPKGKLILDQIRDNITYGGLATDIKEIPGIYDSEGTESVAAHSFRRNSELGLPAPKTKNDPVNNYLFINPNEKDIDYSVIVNDDGSYSTYKRSKDAPKGVETPYTFNELGKKLMAYSFLADNPGKSLAELTSNDQYKSNFKVKFVHNLIKTTHDLDNPSASSMFYHNSDLYSSILKDYTDVLQSNATDQEKYNKALKVYDNLTSLTVQSKSVKNVL